MSKVTLDMSNTTRVQSLGIDDGSWAERNREVAALALPEIVSDQVQFLRLRQKPLNRFE
jgi:hypothetical protein